LAEHHDPDRIVWRAERATTDMLTGFLVRLAATQP